MICCKNWIVYLKRPKINEKEDGVGPFKKPMLLRGAAIIQWICLRLPSCCPGFKSEGHHLFCYHLKSNLCSICHVKRTKINKTGPDLAHLKNYTEKFANQIDSWIGSTALGNEISISLVNFLLISNLVNLQLCGTFKYNQTSKKASSLKSSCSLEIPDF